jgi:HD-GYP domain-containing protein (c-di-GMP phosphodiesterase class II)
MAAIDEGDAGLSPERVTMERARTRLMTRLPATKTPEPRDFSQRIAAAVAVAGDRVQVAALLDAARRVDPSFCTHANGVLSLSVRIGNALGMRRPQLHALGLAAALHDIGKVTVPPNILAKRGPLDGSEWAHVRAHPLEGERLLAPHIASREVLEIVRSHHERWDAAGYPDGLVGDGIPRGARIVAVADAYVAMLEQRPYRAPRSRGFARAELLRESGRQFDPECVTAALRVTGGHIRSS